MAVAQTNTAAVVIERDSRKAKHGNFDEYDALVRNPHGDHPADLLAAVQEWVDENIDQPELADGEQQIVGWVQYDADQVIGFTQK